MSKISPFSICRALTLALLVAGSGCRSTVPTAKLTNGQQAAYKVVVSSTASDRTKAAAAELTNHLARITGTPFELTTGDGRQGIAVGAVADFPELGLGSEYDLKDALHKEDYLLRTHAEGVYLGRHPPPMAFRSASRSSPARTARCGRTASLAKFIRKRIDLRRAEGLKLAS